MNPAASMASRGRTALDIQRHRSERYDARRRLRGPPAMPPCDTIISRVAVLKGRDVRLRRIRNDQDLEAAVVGFSSSRLDADCVVTPVIIRCVQPLLLSCSSRSVA